MELDPAPVDLRLPKEQRFGAITLDEWDSILADTTANDLADTLAKIMTLS